MRPMGVVEGVTGMARFAETFLGELLPREDSAVVVGLSGELGSGKTTFVQRVARALGVREHVTSPTFVILKTYNVKPTTYNLGFEKLVHVDAYRLESAAELERLNWHEVLATPRALVLVEWPERVCAVMPESVLRIDFHVVGEGMREVLVRTNIKEQVTSNQTSTKFKTV